MAEEKSFKKLKIVSDGTTFGTTVQTEDGVNIGGIQYLRFEIGVGPKNEDLLANVFLKIIDVPLELNGKVEVKEERVNTNG